MFLGNYSTQFYWTTTASCEDNAAKVPGHTAEEVMGGWINLLEMVTLHSSVTSHLFLELRSAGEHTEHWTEVDGCFSTVASLL